jgi:RNA polymerase sigma-70 factor (family 1)
MSIAEDVFTVKNALEAPTEQVGLDVLFSEFYNRLVFFSFQLIKDKDHAQDIVQDAFIKYWHQKDAVKADKISIKNFLYTTVRNASLNAVRHAKVVESYVQEHNGMEPEDRPVIDAIITAEVMSSIHSAVQSLPENYRLISVMGYLDGKKNHEIASELAMSVNTVKKQKYRALELLRMKLAPEILALFLVPAIEFLR